MEALELVLLLLAAVLVSSILDQIIPKVSSPLIQICIGVAIALAASDFINIELDSELFLLLFIAPLLYDESRCADKVALLRNIKPVLALAIGLVFMSTLVLGFMTNAFIPSIPLAACFALAAALGPTDAVAVGSLPKDIKIGERKHNILKGEYLLNDASGIVAFQFAIAAVVTGAFNPAEASAQFGISFLGAIVIGVALGYLANWIVRGVKNLGIDNTTFHVLFDLFIPFIIFLVSESFHTSGIIAVVAGGLVRGISSRTIGPNSSRLSIVSNSVWQVFSYALNGVVFVLLGTQLPKAMKNTWDSVVFDDGMLIIYVLAITVMLLAIRFAWLTCEEYIHARHRVKAARAKGDTSERAQFFSKDVLLDALIMTIAGPKGAVTLSIILTIPVLLDSGSFFPQRDLIIFLASGVILLTLLLSNFLLPAIAPKADVSAELEKARQKEIEEYIEILRTVIEELTLRRTPETARATHRIVKSYSDRIERIMSNADIDKDDNVDLLIKVTNWEIQHVLEGVQKGSVTPLVGYQYLSRLTNTINIAEHHSGRINLHYSLSRIRASIAATMNRITNKLPGVTPSERSQALRDLQIETTQWAITQMQERMGELSAPNEDISKLIAKYRRNLTFLRAKSPSLTAMKNTAHHEEEVMRLALNLESEAIQNAADEHRISRATARRLNDNVRLMRVDLEDDELS